MAVLLATVGDKGVNRRDDVLVVQSLLTSKGYKLGRVDGICGVKTIASIHKFQATFIKNTDGLIEPNRKSWLKLISTTNSPATNHLMMWNGDSAQWTQEKKIKSMHVDMQKKVQAVLSALKKRNFQPKIFYAWRSVAVQLTLYSQGNSKVKFSFHNAVKINGVPNSYAADIIDARYGWSTQAKTSGFWKALGEEAKKQGLYWGGDWSSFRDWAHIQLVANSQLARVKQESGL